MKNLYLTSVSNPKKEVIESLAQKFNYNILVVNCSTEKTIEQPVNNTLKCAIDRIQTLLI